ncbi:hypothetical protein SAMD00019534_049270 [Acytostelium subglobosum LB1]|uniref:hypothetical protein n=1 Tax=Acytostelium subglobosum LB1 TaxID=1410327 RepID=UPI0006451BD0|nr:hypothetical protein SAMD00019534_049270 [Acytostelium subglobosum LB1]GAM21752.1 hypothetical protein SAMD00019534_049270 [Acytostelium subglobosum LB1]|eukprot:XP_012754852.1 hypothetical protein SAMD00019534_049270 [Acytostelium subglobosum LB1]
MGPPQYLNNIRNRFNQSNVEDPPTPKEITQPFYNTAQEVMARLEELKKLGNDRYNKQDRLFAISYYSLALQCYDQHQHLQHLNSILKSNTNEFDSIKKLVSIIASNLTLTFIQQGCSPEAITTAHMAIDFDPTNVKALTRLAHALHQVGKLDEAVPHYKHALVIATNQKDKGLLDIIKSSLGTHDGLKQVGQESMIGISTKIANDKTFEQFPIKMVWGGDRPNGGRRMVASKDIPKGTVVFRVAPFATALQESAIPLYCTGCYRFLIESSKCSRCDQKFCEMCQKDDVIIREHKDWCSILRPYTTDKGIKVSERIEIALKTTLRSIQQTNGHAIKQNTPATWRKDGQPFIYDTFTDLHNVWNSPQLMSEILDPEEAKWTSLLTQNIQIVKGPSFVSDEFIDNLFRLITRNIISMTDPIQQTPIGMGIFPSEALVNRSCMANCNSYLDNQGMLVYRSNRAIKAGEEITDINYDPLLPMWDRRAQMMKEHNQYCMCNHCTTFDDREYRCPKCGQPLDMRHLRIWEPQPSIDFDGRVFQCSKGHVTMATVYRVLERMVDFKDKPDSFFTVTIPKYFQQDGLTWNKFKRGQIMYLMNESRMSEAAAIMKTLGAHFQATLGSNAKYIIPHHYTNNYLALARLTQYGHASKREIENNNNQYRKHLEDTIQLSTQFPWAVDLLVLLIYNLVH